MSILDGFRRRWQAYTGEDETPLDGDTPAWLVSLMFHLGLLLAIAFAPMGRDEVRYAVALTTAPEEVEEPIELPEEFQFSDQLTEQVGANSDLGSEMAASLASVVDVASEIPHPAEVTTTEVATIHVNNLVQTATALTHDANLTVRGAVGVNATGAEGAIDRLTQEILLSLEERKTLVVWLFDQSASIVPQRTALRDRFERIYRELGVIRENGDPAFAQYEDKPLLSAIIAFGKGVTPIIDKPTDDVEAIVKAIDEIPIDDSGEEKVFSAVFMAANKYRVHRVVDEDTRQPKRNVMFIVLTDEVGNDQSGAEQTITLCRRYAMPVYVVGVPAPFGRRETLVKWVDPDPQYDQTPRWGSVDQGPESFLPERIRLAFTDGGEEELPIDSGFGPFALTRLCYETGGIFFAVHPNRNVARGVTRGETAVYASHLARFFDPTVMRRYRPDYVSQAEYMRRISANQARAALVKAADMSWLEPMAAPRLRFVKRSEAEFVTDLSEAQQAAAKLEPKLEALFQVLRLGEADRERETVLRWQAGYDLAMGRVMAVKARTEAYNAMLAAAKRGLKFEDSASNTWVLTPANTISVGSQLEKMAERARMYLERVVAEHPDTPWAVMAARELETPIGWEWSEETTDLTPRNNAAGGNNAPGGNMVGPRKPTRPPPKL